MFPGRKKVIFVHGCFWHGHFWFCNQCSLAREPAGEQWKRKLAGNVARDEAVVAELREAGWEVLVIWECDLCNFCDVRDDIVAFLGAPTGRSKARER